MKKLYWVVVVGIVLAIGILYWRGDLLGSSTEEGPQVAVVAGWNTITVPDGWPDTTAQAFCIENPSITMLSYWSGTGWTNYVVGIEATNFDIHAGMVLHVYATGDGYLSSY